VVLVDPFQPERLAQRVDDHQRRVPLADDLHQVLDCQQVECRLRADVDEALAECLIVDAQQAQAPDDRGWHVFQVEHQHRRACP